MTRQQLELIFENSELIYQVDKHFDGDSATEMKEELIDAIYKKIEQEDKK